MTEKVKVPSNLVAMSALAAAILVLAGCRGGDGTDGVDSQLLDFVETPDPDRFLQFLNQRRDHTSDAVTDNVRDFPEAYYNTIDPTDSRTTLDDWKIANGFLTASGDEAACDIVDNCCVPQMEVTAQCRVVSTKVQFRDTRDLGYGRDMEMREVRLGENAGDVAIFVRNFKVDEIEGLPYGPLNLEALIAQDNYWQFGVNAIEFSTWPYGAGEPSGELAADDELQNRKFAKFYNFAGDGRIDAGARQTRVDLDERGLLPMPYACVTCHGGVGTTVVDRDSDGVLTLEATLHGELPGDLQAHLQWIDVESLQFSTAQGFRQQDHEAGLRAINDAVLASYKEHQSFVADRFDGGPSGYWDPQFAISLLEGRLSGTGFDASHVPTDWLSVGSDLYTDFIGPNCHSCHALQGNSHNNRSAFPTPGVLDDYRGLIDHLVFQQGLMPLGLWSYREFWDLKQPAALATQLGLSNRVEDAIAITPGRPVAQIAAPLVESKTAGSIVLNGGSSAFADNYEWSVSPSSATIVANGASARLNLPDSPDDSYEVTLRVSNADYTCPASDAPDCVQSWTIDLSEATPLPTGFCDADGVGDYIQSNCVACHSAGVYSAIPVIFEDVCSLDAVTAEREFRHLQTRVDVDSPLDSMLLRKSTNGATQLDLVTLSNPPDGNDSSISGYHVGGLLLNAPRALSTMINWINLGAPAP